MESSRSIRFSSEAFGHFVDWATVDRKVFNRIAELIEEVRRTPFSGKGKPEPLKHEFKGCWSRRITQEHRLIYEVTTDEIRILSVRDHY